MARPKLFLIDANSFCYRAYYAIRNLSTSYGQPTNAIFGFINMLKKILQDNDLQYLGICFDVGRKTFRQEQFSEYKLHRPAMPDELRSQMPLIKEIISAYNIPIFEMEGFEADDVIATLAKKAAKENLEVFIVSSDKDIFQLIDERVKVYSPNKEGSVYDLDNFKSRFQVAPDKIADLIGLMGDATDNIPGVKGVGEKTAVSLLKQFGNLDNLFKNLDKVKSEKLRELLSQQKNQAVMSKDLAKLDKEVPLEFDQEQLKIKEPDYEKLFELFKKLELNSFLKDLPKTEQQKESVKLVRLEEKTKIEDFVKELEKKNKETAFLIALEEIVVQVFISVDKKTVYSLRFADLSKIASLFENKNIPKIVYDFKTTLILLKNSQINLEGIIFDTMLAAYLLDPAKSKYDIEDLAWQYLKIPAIDLGADVQSKVKLLLELRPILEKVLKERTQLELFYNVEIPLASVLAKMEISGIAVDREILEKLSEKVSTRLAKLVSQIYKEAKTEFNINSPKQLSKILFEDLKLPVVKRIKTGFSTDEEVLRKLADKHAIANNILEYRQLTKLQTGYIDSLPELINPNTGRVHTSFNQTVTETGRLSSSNPNLQNIPIKTDIGRQIRKAFVPGEKDYLLLSADYSQIELRILAHLSKAPDLIDAFKADKDIHKITAALIFNKKLDEIDEKMRDTAKRINFGIIYGMSSFGLSKDLGISQEEAQAFIDAYFLRYPKVKEYMQKQIELAQKEGFVKTLLGRRRYIPEINNKNFAVRQFAERQAINTPVQGSAADLIKLAMIDIQKEIENNKLESRLLLQVHDELVFEFPKKEKDLLKKT
ncbi:MAG: DNA polymerase I, partial [Candidatus Omnitrophica bacterium]|nr:DNA polymerase I [Candidatus Omnitrophota bacterium]